MTNKCVRVINFIKCMNMKIFNTSVAIVHYLTIIGIAVKQINLQSLLFGKMIYYGYFIIYYFV